MSDKVFLDTNVLIYAATAMQRGGKHRRRDAIVAEADFGISTQVVGEFVDNVQTEEDDDPLTDDEVAAGSNGCSSFRDRVDRELVEPR